MNSFVMAISNFDLVLKYEEFVDVLIEIEIDQAIRNQRSSV